MRHYLIGFALLCAPHAVAADQGSFTGYDYYDLYGAGYEPDNYHDDWFYDYFALGERNTRHAYGFVDYDHERGRFVWETTPPAPATERDAPNQASAGGDEGEATAPRARLTTTAQVPPVCRETEDARRRRMNTVRTVRGRIVRTKTVSVRDAVTETVNARQDGDLHNVVAMLATEEGATRLIVDLGPVGQVEPHVLRPGQPVTAEGFVKRLGDRQVLVARRVATADGHMRTLDRQGQALMARRALGSHRGDDAPAEADAGTRPSAEGTTEATGRQAAPGDTAEGIHIAPARDGASARPPTPVDDPTVDAPAPSRSETPRGVPSRRQGTPPEPWTGGADSDGEGTERTPEAEGAPEPPDAEHGPEPNGDPRRNARPR